MNHQQIILFYFLILFVHLPPFHFYYSVLSSSSSTATATAVTANETKLYAIYFPQFHRDWINDQLWGDNFTEWTNLNSSPRLNRLNHSIARPTELGFYDLLDVSVRRKQRELAIEYGIDGFLYHHYWFYNHQQKPAPLSGVLEKFLIDHEPAIPFAFNWAKESWVSTWHARHSEKKLPNEEVVLVQQLTPRPNDERIREHYDYLRRFFHHELYLKINGVPFFHVYGHDQRSIETLAIINRLRRYAMNDGFPAPGLHVPTMRKMSMHPLSTRHDFPTKLGKTLMSSFPFASVWYYPFADAPSRQMILPDPCRAHQIKPGLHAEFPSYLGVNSVFDNTPRRSIEEAHILDRSTFGNNLSVGASLEWDILTTMIYERCCQHSEVREKGAKLVTINAWNEWGEGMVLEPSDKYGRSLLEAVQRAKDAANKITCDFSAYDEHLRQLK